LIDDVVDSGETLFEALNIITLIYDPRSIRTAVLVDKKKNRVEYGIVGAPDIVGFTYEGDGFLVGRGMGFGEQHRGLHNLYVLEEG
jgi:hypoxanthine-guanine phosphoribosyltransferase